MQVHDDDSYQQDDITSPAFDDGYQGHDDCHAIQTFDNCYGYEAAELIDAYDDFAESYDECEEEG